MEVLLSNYTISLVAASRSRMMSMSFMKTMMMGLSIWVIIIIKGRTTTTCKLSTVVRGTEVSST